MIYDFSGITAIDTPNGALAKIERNGVVLWEAQTNKPVVLQVEKITSDTYAGETTYTGEQFILLDIYPKTNGTVKVTYGGLTKTITDTSGAESPNAQQVFFGTFNGVSDEVETPASGELTIDGDCYAFATADYAKTSKDTLSPTCNCVTAIISFGTTIEIPDYAFSSTSGDACKKITSVEIPSTISHIGERAFITCTGLTSLTIKNGVKSIGRLAFSGCRGLSNVIIPASVKTIEENPFSNINKQNILKVDSKNVWYKMDGNCLIDIVANRVVSGFLDSIIPSYVTAIGSNAFHYLEDLTSITIPDTITSIEDQAFFMCTSLTSVIILATTPPELGSSVFNVSGSEINSNVIITVPAGYGDVYKSADGWSTYAYKIVEAS